MDERRLAELFRDAAGDAPPASFDEHDVATESRRVTRRRRSMLAGGSGVAVVALAAGLLLGPGGFGHTLGGGTQGAASAPAVRGGPVQPDQSPFGPAVEGPAARGTDSFPSSSPAQGGGKVGGVGPNAGSTRIGCGPTDREVAVALAGELPSVGAPTTVTPGLTCGGTTRAATYLVRDGAATGYVTAVLSPRADPATLTMRGGVLSSTGTSASGKWQVTVVGEPAGGQVPPLADRLGAVERAIAARF